MKGKKDTHVLVGLGIAVLIIVLAVFGYSRFGKSVPVPQVDRNTITEENVNALPTGSELLNKKEQIYAIK